MNPVTEAEMIEFLSLATRMTALELIEAIELLQAELCKHEHWHKEGASHAAGSVIEQVP